MAGQIPPQFIDELLARVDIVDVIDPRVPLKKAGKNLQACCPFHNEKSPSFTVSPEKQFYHCFGCGAHGTSIGFLMEFDQLSFPEAIQELADLVGMAVPTTYNAAPAKGNQTLYELMDKAAKFYSHQLQTHSQSQLFTDYIKKRGLSDKTVNQFELGMAPDGWDNLLKVLGGSEQRSAQLLEAGLVIKNNEKNRIYDRFRQRLMFPIKDRRGRTVGFGGRVLDDSTPKYLNSPETPIFHKGTELYGLYQARKANRKLSRILIVEGYMDVIGLAEQGITNAVATLGTSLTADHLRLLSRTAPEIVFCFDGDRAGRDAAWRSLERALPMLGGNQQYKFMFLPEGQDPDSLVKAQGPEAFERRVELALNYSDFFFEQLCQQVDINSMDGRARLVEVAKPYFNQIPAGVYRDMMQQRLAELTKTNVATINKHSEPAKQNTLAKKNVKKPSMANMTPIRMAITIVLQYPILAREVEITDLIRQLGQPGIAIFCELVELLQNNPHLTTSMLLERWRDREGGTHLQKLAMQPLTLSGEALQHELLGVVTNLTQQAKMARIEMLTSKPLAELSSAERAEIKALQQEAKSP